MKKFISLSLLVVLFSAQLAALEVQNQPVNQNNPVPTQQNNNVQQPKTEVAPKNWIKTVSYDEAKKFFASLGKREYLLIGGGAAAVAVLYYALSSAFASSEDKEFDFE